jgi:hypothetical protein
VVMGERPGRVLEAHVRDPESRRPEHDRAEGLLPDDPDQ